MCSNESCLLFALSAALSKVLISSRCCISTLLTRCFLTLLVCLSSSPSGLLAFYTPGRFSWSRRGQQIRSGGLRRQSLLPSSVLLTVGTKQAYGEISGVFFFLFFFLLTNHRNNQLICQGWCPWLIWSFSLGSSSSTLWASCCRKGEKWKLGRKSKWKRSEMGSWTQEFTCRYIWGYTS